jgi:hypothetical protein
MTFPLVLSCGCIHEPDGRPVEQDYVVNLQGECLQIAERFSEHPDNQEFREAFSVNHDRHRSEVAEYNGRIANDRK